VGDQDAADIIHTKEKEEYSMEAGNSKMSAKWVEESSRQSFEIIDASLVPRDFEVPNMWSKHYIGLYSQYAAVGLLYGSSGTLIPFCVYEFDGTSNVCANAKNIVFFAWSFKIFFAILTDSIRPLGMRRKPWMIMGWSIVLMILFILAFAAESMNVSLWLTSLMFMQCFLMLSDVPADGYCVELGQLEPKEQRGQILATGQRIRFSFCIVAGFIQMFLLNGPSTNSSGCSIDFLNCWAWGLTVNQYYGFLFAVVFILTVPIIWLKEINASHIPQHDFQYFLSSIWATFKNLTTFYLLVFVIGNQALTNFTNNVNIYLQYYIIKLTNFQAGLDTVTTYLALVISIWLFQKYLINRNWRYTQYYSTITAALLGLVWIAPFHNAGGTMDPWFTIFIDLDTSFAQGLSQVLYSMAVIELAKPGLEATTFELIVTVGNAALTLNGIISTQLLTPMKSVGCDDDYGHCSSGTVVVTGKDSFEASDGPTRFTNYTLLLTGVSLTACYLFTRFLPASKEECHLWKLEGERRGDSSTRGRIALCMAVVVMGYGIIAAILLLDVDTACQPAIGGSGC
jgi:arginine/serine-rich splicing factor 1/9